MLNKWMLAVACMGCTLSSQAAVQAFDWTYSGFQQRYSTETNPWGVLGPVDPDNVVGGRFEAEDVNNDGTFSRSEVRKFVVAGESLTECPAYKTGCYLHAFSYTPGGKLTFDYSSSSEFGTWGSGWERNSTNYRFSDSWEYSYYGFSMESDWSSSGAMSSTYLASAETKFAISPVPEPQAWLMLGAGIVLLGAAKRRVVRPRQA